MVTGAKAFDFLVYLPTKDPSSQPSYCNVDITLTVPVAHSTYVTVNSGKNGMQISTTDATVNSSFDVTIVWMNLSADPDKATTIASKVFKIEIVNCAALS